MADLIRRGGLTYSIRVHIPRKRQADVGRAYGSRNGTRAEIVRTLETSDRAEAVQRAKTAEAAIWAEVNERLRKAGLPVIGRDWRPNWAEAALAYRAQLAAVDGQVVPDPMSEGAAAEGTPGRDFLLMDGGLAAEIEDDARHLQETHGPAVAERFRSAIFETRTMFNEAAKQWLTELRRQGAVRAQTVAGHEAVFALFREFLKTQQVPAETLALADVTRRLARGFVQWRSDMPSSKGSGKITGATIRRELSSLSGLWRWARREGSEGVETNPWEDQAGSLAPRARRGGADDDAEEAGEGSKRPYTPAELVALLRATGDDWAPNGGGYGAALWDAVRLGLLTGLRANELAGLRCGDVKDGGTSVAVRSGKTRNARRVVPLCEPAQAVVAARLAALPNTAAADPLFPEVPPSGPDGRRGKMLAQRFAVAMRRILGRTGKGLSEVDMHSLRRSFAQALRDAMESGQSTINATLIGALMGHQEATLALRVYGPNALAGNMRRAVDEMMEAGLSAEVKVALEETGSLRPLQTRTSPAAAPAREFAERLGVPKRRRGRPPNSYRSPRR